MNSESEWLPIFEYSKLSGKSISTIRRYIKGNKLRSKIVDGKYFLHDDKLEYDNDIQAQKIINLEKQIHLLKKQLQFTQNELSEHKMLVELYEKQLKQPQ